MVTVAWAVAMTVAMALIIVAMFTSSVAHCPVEDTHPMASAKEYLGCWLYVPVLLSLSPGFLCIRNFKMSSEILTLY